MSDDRALDSTNAATAPPDPQSVLSGGQAPAAPAPGNDFSHQGLDSGQAPSSPIDSESAAQGDPGYFHGSGAPAAAPAQPQSKWERILMGMVEGMAGGAGAKNFAQGMAGGARASLAYGQQRIENQQKQQEIDLQKQSVQSNIRFQSAHAASLVADTALKDAQLHALPQKLQDEHTSVALEQLKDMQALGLTPTIVVDNTTGGDSAKAGMQQLTDSQGGVPPMFSIVMGNKIVNFDLNQLAQAPPTLGEVNKIRTLTGQPAMTPAQWAQTPAQVKAEQTKTAYDFWAPMPTEANLTQYKNFLNTAQASPDSPDKAANVARLQGLVDRMTGGLNDMHTRANKEAGDKIRAEIPADTAKAQAIIGVQRAFQNEDIKKAAASLVHDPSGLTTITSLASMRGDERLRLYNAAKELDPKFDPGLIERRAKFIDSYQDPKGRAAINRQAINNVAQHSADLLDINNEYRRTDVKLLNTPLNKLKAQNSTVYTRYETVSGVLKDELSLYFAGGYAPSKEQESTWNRIQSGDATPAQTEAFSREILSLASRRASTFNSQFKGVMGYDDPNLISPDAKAAANRMGVHDLDKFGSGGTMGQPGSGGGNTAPNPTGARPRGW